VLIDRCYPSYCRAPPQTRRRFNQAVFGRVEVKDREIIAAEYREPLRRMRENREGHG
jgi:hypothetical protein